MKKSKKNRMLFSVLLLLCYGFFFVTGCTFTSPRAFSPLNTLYYNNLKTLEKGNIALEKGDPEKARDIFQDLQQKALAPDIQLRCRYGLACAELALADSVAEFEAALELWHLWLQQIPPGKESGDPRLLYPLLLSRLSEKKAFFAKIQALQAQVNDQNAKTVQAKDRDISALNEKLKTKNQEIRQLEQQLDALKIRISKLEHQINAMNAIDQKIAEKKEKIAAP